MKWFSGYFDKYMQKILVRRFVIYWRRISKRIRAEKKALASPRLLWGPVAIINNKYWSEALKKDGWNSTTLMGSVAQINDRSDFDLYFSDLEFKGFGKLLLRLFRRYTIVRDLLIFDYSVKHFDIFHLPCSGFCLGYFKNWELEYHIFSLMGCKIIIMPFGGDFFRFSTLLDKCWTHAMLSNYPDLAKKENEISKQVNFWVEKADFFFSGSQLDGIGRWDTLVFNASTINLETWSPRHHHSSRSGIDEAIRIVHTPNHRAVKGTEYIIRAIEQLQKEGFKIDFILIEKRKNTEVNRILCEEADILVEQLVYSGYGLSAVEGMAAGIPVICNLEDENRTRVFRRYSYLNECPVVSSNVENIKDNLKTLILNPALRRVLGKAGRAFVEKYNSEKQAQFLFKRIYQKVWYGEKDDLVNLFHPLYKNSYNNLYPIIQHPLIENRIPPEALDIRKIQ